MADKRIFDLTEAETVTRDSLFVVEQNRQTKKLSGQTMTTYLTGLVNAHGMIKDIVYEEPQIDNPLEATMVITLADNTEYRIPVYNGDRGETGIGSYGHVKYSDNMPTRNSDMKDSPSNYMGFCNTDSPTAPTTYSSYKWYKIKGETGQPGINGLDGLNGADGRSVTLERNEITYAVSNSGTAMPEDWYEDIPSVPEGQYLWTRVVLEFNSGLPVTYYTVSKSGSTGDGGGGGGLGSIGLTNIGGLKIQGSPLTSDGEISIGHANSPITARTSTGLCEIKYDTYGHITSAREISATASGQFVSWNGTSWVATNPPRAGVNSVNGKTGDVTTTSVSHISIDLYATDWENGQQSVEIGQYDADTTNFIVSPSPDNFEAYSTAMVRADAYSSPNLTFKVKNVPSVNLSVNVMIVKEA